MVLLIHAKWIMPNCFAHNLLFKTCIALEWESLETCSLWWTSFIVFLRFPSRQIFICIPILLFLTWDWGSSLLNEEWEPNARSNICKDNDPVKFQMTRLMEFSFAEYNYFPILLCGCVLINLMSSLDPDT